MLTVDLEKTLTHIERTIKNELTKTITQAVEKEIKKRDLQMLSVVQVKDLLNVSKETVYTYINSGLLPASKLGREYQIRPQDLAEFEEMAIGYDLTDEKTRTALKKDLITHGKSIRPFK